MTSSTETDTTIEDLDLSDVPSELSSKFILDLSLSSVELEEGSYKTKRGNLARVMTKDGLDVTTQDIPIDLVHAVVKALPTEEAVPLPEEVRTAIARNRTAPKVAPSRPKKVRIRKTKTETKTKVEPELTFVEESSVRPEIAVSATNVQRLCETVLKLPPINSERPPTQVAKQIAGAHAKVHHEVTALLEGGGLSRKMAEDLRRVKKSIDRSVDKIMKAGRRDFDFANCQSASISTDEQVRLAQVYVSAWRNDPREEMALSDVIDLKLADSY